MNLRRLTAIAFFLFTCKFLGAQSAAPPAPQTTVPVKAPAISQPYIPQPRRLEILFLGHTSQHHNSEQLVDILAKEYFKSGLNFTYTANPDDLNETTLRHYDALLLYANYDSISKSQETALLQFVRNGKGFIPIHCASWCFRNSAAVVDLIGGQFKSHGYDSFPAILSMPEHPILKDVPAFLTTDETYVHDKLSNQIQVITERMEGTRKEPYTWIREYGKGRVFYTAYGHDEHSFLNKDFLRLVKNGILWAVGDHAAADLAAYPIANPGYSDARIPNYEKRIPPPRFQAPLSPTESKTLIQVPVGFELKLFASEPDIINPICMNWDERGRLWVIETIDYPNTVRTDKESGQDRIKILEDTDGDGKADKVTEFADKLNIPTGFCFSNGGIVVAQAPYFLFLKDTSGDDKADIRDTIMTGWGVFDTHAVASNLRYGFDNQLWGVVGYSGFKGKIGGDSLEFSQGIYRFKPDTKEIKKFEYLGATSNNTWGLGFSEEFDVFASTANNTHSVFFGIPQRLLPPKVEKENSTEKIDAHYALHPVTKNLRQVDVFGGFTAACGQSLYTARNYPKEYWNKIAFVCEPTGRLIHAIHLRQEGAGFREQGDGRNFFASADEWCAPIQAEVGPDGNVWVADWYDFIIQHNPTPEGYETGKGNAHINPLRDHERGRIWRIVYKDAPQQLHPPLNRNDSHALVEALSDSNLFWRTTAQRMLVEKGDRKIAPALYALIKDRRVDDAGINAPAIHALWTLHGLGLLKGNNKEATAAAVSALTHPAGGVRRTAVLVLGQNPAAFAAYRKARIFEDPDLRVRLAAILTLADGKASDEIFRLLTNLEKRKSNRSDRWIAKAIHASLLKYQQTDNKTAGLAIHAKPDQVIRLTVLRNQMKYDQGLVIVKAGSLVRLDLQNLDFMQHNLLILKPGTQEQVGAAADKLAQNPTGAAQQYVPHVPEVLFATRLVNPQATYTLNFRVPGTPGDYPYICSFPGHWRIMNGILRVIKP